MVWVRLCLWPELHYLDLDGNYDHTDQGTYTGFLLRPCLLSISAGKLLTQQECLHRGLQVYTLGNWGGQHMGSLCEWQEAVRNKVCLEGHLCLTLVSLALLPSDRALESS